MIIFSSTLFMSGNCGVTRVYIVEVVILVFWIRNSINGLGLKVILSTVVEQISGGGRVSWLSCILSSKKWRVRVLK